VAASLHADNENSLAAEEIRPSVQFSRNPAHMNFEVRELLCRPPDLAGGEIPKSYCFIDAIIAKKKNKSKSYSQ
jgi:hypothetical protein